MHRRRRRIATLAATALVLALGQAPLAQTSAQAATDTVTLVGSLQSEAGCEKDWDPACEATQLTKDGSVWSRQISLPKGSFEYKIAINKGWEENYGAGGAKDGANIPLVIEGPATLVVGYDETTHAISMAPTSLAGESDPGDKANAGISLRAPLTKERFYFVMADRFANGDKANDTGGLAGDRLTTGFDPTDKGFYHGGDLKGIAQKLDYIKGLGTTAIWLTPSFKNRPVQGSGADASAGYHGYWITDFTQIDPHLGTNEDMKALVDAAHAKGMKVFFDIITNHTADVLAYKENKYTYISKEAAPYKDASGQVFDDAQYAGTDTFPPLDANTSFPYTPTFRTEADHTVKVPAWLNDPTMYHNRGDSTFAGESSEYGDFVGLDDLFTERPDVVKGMGDIYKTWADFGIDGFRIDTVKHVNMEFWQEFAPDVLGHAKATNEDFFMFGEIYDSRPSFLSQYTTKGKLQAALDFGFQSAAVNFAQGKPGTGLRDFYADDDYYIDADSNAYQSPTFLGNHDMGRVAMMLKGTGGVDAQLMSRVRLANELMYLTRGQPVVYYGDEQGFVGAGGDKDARQDMFATRTAQYASEQVLGGASGSKDRFDTTHPLYRQLAGLAALRTQHPALADGAQIHRYASNSAGVYAFSRIDTATNREYVVAINNSDQPAGAAFGTFTSNATFRSIHGGGSHVRSDKNSRVNVSVPAMSARVWQSSAPMDKPRETTRVRITSPAPGASVGGRAPITAAVSGNAFQQVTFAYRPVGTQAWQALGTDDNAPYRVFHDVSDLAKGTLLEYRAIAKDTRGTIVATSSYGVVGDATAPRPGGGGASGPVVQPDAVSAPGSHNTEMGCAEDWQPACAQAQLTLSPTDKIWKGTHEIPAGEYEYKAAINKSWDENYGAGGAAQGANITYKAPGGPVNFYYDHATHYITSDAQGPILTAPGSYQSELGCTEDWQPDCMRPWLQDPDGDGTYTWSSSEIPAGSYEFKVAHGLSWAENYGAGGVKEGPNVSVSVPSDGTVVTISYTLSTHAISATTSRAGSAPDLTKAKAVWVERDLIAWPATGLPAGLDPELARFSLNWAPEGGLRVDAEAVPGGSTAAARYDGPLPDAVVSAHPELKGYVGLRLDARTARAVPDILRAQVAVSMADDLGRILDVTGVQIAYVLDHVYADAAQDASLGVSFAGRRPSFALWAPTARKVTLLTWGPRAGAAPSVRSAQRQQLRLDRRSGVWSGSAGERNSRYLFQVEVFVPSTGKVVQNLVTDPYSVGLTLNSARSVAVDLKDKAFQPAQWVSTKAPTLAQPVDTTVYELHIRDFSISDPSVSERNRGSYLAFTENSRGTKHLRELAKAGMNTVHLLPSFDIATIEEDPAKQAVPECDLASHAADSEAQQACIEKIRAKDGFNWGYDPYHYSTPEGSYASSPRAADGGTRVAEFRSMVGALHANGYRVVLDKVYNHTAASGQADRSVLDRVVPGYYHRLNATGAVETSTCCQNIATEHSMAQKLMVDSVVTWARGYKVDGFRFDLMGHHSRANMEAVRAALDSLTMAKDGVDGKKIYVYGEGWNFGEVADNARFQQASQGQLDSTGIGTFSDRLRDAVRGGGPFDENPTEKKGFGSGGTSGHDVDLVQLGLAGNLKDYSFRDSTGKTVRGDQVDYNGDPAGYATSPEEVVTYVDAHDNETLWDVLTLKLPVDLPMAERVRMNTVSLSTVLLAQTPAFMHAGADQLRSKSLDRNSYDSGDWFNVIDWSGKDNGFGRGLPPAADNKDKWQYMKPLLANPALKPTAADIATARAATQDLLRLRFSTTLFRLGSADAIKEKVSFPVSGTADAEDSVIVMHIDDEAGSDADPALKRVVVVFNASGGEVAQKIPSLAGKQLRLHDLQARGSDPRVREASWNATTGLATVPARTVAVFVE